MAESIASSDSMPDYKYWAFVSYGHDDEAWARWLHVSIERYVVPRALIGAPTPNGPRPRRMIPVFRDREELASSGNLPNQIYEALRQSRFLIVVCSPKAAVSRWVNEEIKSFKRLGRDDRVLAFIIDGEPNATDRPDAGLLEAFPRALRFRVGADGELASDRSEPLAADARPEGDGKQRALLKLLAGMLGIGFDDLLQRERRRRVRRMLQVATAAILALAALTAFWVNRQRALDRQEQINLAQGLANEALQRRSAIDPTLSALLAVESLRIAPTTDGVSAALATLAVVPRRLGEFRHEGRVTFLSFALDGSALVSAATTGPGPGDRSTIRSWDLTKARQVSEVVQNDVVRADELALSADHALLATIAPPGSVSVWDLRTGAERHRLLHGQSIRSLVFGAAQQWIATTGGGKLKIWNAGTGDLLVEFNDIDDSVLATPPLDHDKANRWSLAGHSATNDKETLAWVASLDRGKSQSFRQKEPVFALAVSADGAKIAVSGRTTVVFNTDTGVAMGRLPHAAERLAFVGSNGLLTANEDSAQLWDLSTFSPVNRIDYRQRFGRASVVALSPGRSTVATATGNTVFVWDVATAREIGRLPHSSFVTGAAFSRDGFRLATGSDDGVVRVWEVAPKVGTVLGHDGRVFTFSITADGSRVTTAGEDGVVVWDPSTSKPLRKPFGAGTLSIETLSPDGRLVAAARGGLANEPDTVVVADAATGKERCHLPHPITVGHMVFSANGQHLVTQSGSTITFWQMPTGQKARTFESNDAVESFALSPDGQHLAVASGNTTDLWNANTAQKTSTLSFKGIVKAITFSADSALVATMSGSGVRVWDARTANQRAVLAHDEFVRGISFDLVDHHLLTFSGREANVWRHATTDRQRLPHDEDVVDGAFDSTGQHVATLTKSAVHVWDAAAGREIASLPVDEELTSVTFSAGDRLVVVGGSGRLVRLFRWRAEDLITDVCNRLTHNMTPSQWSTYFKERPYQPTCPNVTARP